MRLKDRVAIVVGAGQSPGEGIGNGRATALTFAREGARVLCVDHNLASAQETVDMIAARDGTAAAFRADVTQNADLKAMVDDAHARWGRIDILHNNVGVSIAGGDAELLEITEEALDRLAGSIPPARSTPFTARLASLFPRFNPQTWLLRLLPRATLPFWKGQLLAVGLTLVSSLLRHYGTPLIGTTSVFTAFFPAIVISALWGGPGAAATATVLSTIAGAVISYSIEGSGVGWLMFALVAAVVAVVTCSVRAALDIQHFRSGALEDRDRELASISRELDHRSKNTLAVVAALTRQACQASDTTEEMRDRLCGHFAAMGAAQTMLLQVGAKGLPVRQLIEESLAPFIQDGRIAVEVDPAMAAPSGCEVMLSLAFNELATNSCKYGALSVPAGEIHVASSSAGSDARLVWSESGGPRVQAPGASSTGSRLIGRTLASAPGGRVEMSFHPAGFRCEFSWSAVA